jgi:hypothetical protein
MEMKKYIFITPEGTTFSPNGNEIENMQVIAIVEDVYDENYWWKMIGLLILSLM